MVNFWQGFEKRGSGLATAAELGGLGVLMAPSIQSLRGKPMKEKHKDIAEVGGLGILMAPYIHEIAKKLVRK